MGDKEEYSGDADCFVCKITEIICDDGQDKRTRGSCQEKGRREKKRFLLQRLQPLLKEPGNQ